LQREVSKSSLHIWTTSLRFYIAGSFVAAKSTFYAAMTSPVGGLVDRMLEAISEDNKFSTFISLEQKRAVIISIFSAYYHPQSSEELQELMESILIAGLN